MEGEEKRGEKGLLSLGEVSLLHWATCQDKDSETWLNHGPHVTGNWAGLLDPLFFDLICIDLGIKAPVSTSQISLVFVSAFFKIDRYGGIKTLRIEP